MGPGILRPDINVIDYQGKPYLPADAMPYGTIVDVRLKIDNEYYYIPAVVIDSKEHTAPYGVFQTQVSVIEPGDLYSKAKQFIEAGKDEGASIIEWYTDPKITYNGSEISKSEGLRQYDSYIDIIVYDKIAWGSY